MPRSKIIFALFLASTAAVAQAQYKCVINGKTVYADAPCARDARPVGELAVAQSQPARVRPVGFFRHLLAHFVDLPLAKA